MPYEVQRQLADMFTEVPGKNRLKDILGSASMAWLIFMLPVNIYNEDYLTKKKIEKTWNQDNQTTQTGCMTITTLESKCQR